MLVVKLPAPRDFSTENPTPKSLEMSFTAVSVVPQISLEEPNVVKVLVLAHDALLALSLRMGNRFLKRAMQWSFVVGVELVILFSSILIPNMVDCGSSAKLKLFTTK